MASVIRRSPSSAELASLSTTSATVSTSSIAGFFHRLASEFTSTMAASQEQRFEEDRDVEMTEVEEGYSSKAEAVAAAQASSYPPPPLRQYALIDYPDSPHPSPTLSSVRPLQEEKTEIYYSDDTRKCPQPTPEELASFGINVRDYGYNNPLPPIPPYIPPHLRPGYQQRQPTPTSDKPPPSWILNAGRNEPGEAGESASSGRNLGLGRNGLVRNRTFADLSASSEPLSQESDSSSSSLSQSQPPPLDFGSSQEESQDSEPYIVTPSVTPKGSLQWPGEKKTVSDDPASQLDLAETVAELNQVKAKWPLATPLPPHLQSYPSEPSSIRTDSPEPSDIDITLPQLSSSLPKKNGKARMASEAPTEPTEEEEEIARPTKRQRVRVAPESPSPSTRAAAAPLPSPPTASSSTLPAPSPPTQRYYLRKRPPRPPPPTRRKCETGPKIMKTATGTGASSSQKRGGGAVRGGRTKRRGS